MSLEGEEDFNFGASWSSQKIFLDLKRDLDQKQKIITIIALF